jgi:hypothetical protein
MGAHSAKGMGFMIKPEMKAYARDLAERVIVTFLQGFIAAWLLAPAYDTTFLKACAFAGLTAAASYVKNTLALLKSGTVSPASLAPAPAPTEDGGP